MTFQVYPEQTIVHKVVSAKKFQPTKRVRELEPEGERWYDGVSARGKHALLRVVLANPSESEVIQVRK